MKMWQHDCGCYVDGERQMHRCPDHADTPMTDTTPETGHILRELLKELVTLVRGECPSLLNEDSGGDGRLSIAIDEALRRAAPASPPTVEFTDDTNRGAFQAASPPTQFVRCGYCLTWNSRPCGEQCAWSPDGEKFTALPPQQERTDA